MTKKHRLGRGLDALIVDKSAQVEAVTETGGQVVRIPIDSVMRSPFQPRQDFPAEGMEDLVRSVKTRGVIQPVLVRRNGEKFELIAGERRYRAAREAQLAEIPAIVREATDQEVLELALVENMLREDLNVIEQAEGCRVFIDKFGMTQEQIADRLGKARATVANTLRLLDLPDEVKEYVRQDQLQSGHAKVLLGLEIPEERVFLARQAIKEDLSVRQLESLVEKRKRAPRRRRASRDDIPSVHVSNISDLIRRHLGTSVRIASCRTMANGKKIRGCIEIDFFSSDDLSRILEVLGVSETSI